MKKILSIAALAGLALQALPASAASQSGNVTLKWNISASVSMTIYTDYNSTGTQGTTAPSILANLNGGSGQCTAPTSAPAQGTVDWGSITPDLVNVTDCYYKNAVNAQIVTNSKNWSLSEAFGASPAFPTGYLLCAAPNGYTFGSAPTSLPATQSTVTSAPSATTSCPTGTSAISTTALNMISADATSFPNSSPANVGEDLELAVPAGAATGAFVSGTNLPYLVLTAVAN